MTVKLLRREDLTAMIMTHSDVVLVYVVDGTDEMVVGTADQIEGLLEESARGMYEGSAYESIGGKHYPITLDEAKDKVWDCASICTQEDYLKEQAEIESEQE